MAVLADPHSLKGGPDVLLSRSQPVWADHLADKMAARTSRISLRAGNYSGVSWDLDLLPAEHGDDPAAWLEQAADGGDEEAARRHAELVRSRRPELEIGGPFEGAFQLTLPEESGLPLDVGLYGTHASISVAYWDLGEREGGLADVVVDIVDVLTEANGWAAYDPQEDRVVRGDEVHSLFLSGRSWGVGVVKDIQNGQEKPKRKRRFGSL